MTHVWKPSQTMLEIKHVHKHTQIQTKLNAHDIAEAQVIGITYNPVRPARNSCSNIANTVSLKSLCNLLSFCLNVVILISKFSSSLITRMSSKCHIMGDLNYWRQKICLALPASRKCLPPHQYDTNSSPNSVSKSYSVFNNAQHIKDHQ